MSGGEDTSLSPVQPAAAGGAAARPGAPLRRRLFQKYATLLIALVGGALLITSTVDFWFSYQENKAALIRVQQEKAQAEAQRIEEFVGAIERQIGWTTHAEWASGPLDQRRQDYFRLLRQVPAITELTELDGEGREQLKVSRLAMDVIGSNEDLSRTPGFTEAKVHRLWFSPVYFRKQSEPYMTLAMARDGRDSGVTVAEINLKLIWDVITALKIGQGGYAYVVDGRGRLIAHPDLSLVLRDTNLSKLPQVAAALTPTPGGAVGASAGVARNLAGDSVLTAHAAIGQLGGLMFVEVPLREAFAPLYRAAWRTALLLAFGLGAAALVALWLARRMTGPIRAIAAGAERIGQGDLDRRIDIRTGDEIEALAGQFNRMAGDLQRSYAELEQRVRDRTAELSEALDQQTATAEVLGVINSSPGDLAPVFDAILEKAHTLCGAAHGSLQLYDGENLRAVATQGVSPQFAEILRQGYTAAESPASRDLLAGRPFSHIANCADVDHPVFRSAAEIAGIRTVLFVPLRRDEAFLGLISAARLEIHPFSDKQIALLQNFAAQAVIAMENARLITETREALEQQTATAEVLQVINSSPGDLAPVFDVMLEKAMRLCEAAFGTLAWFDGQMIGALAIHGVPDAFAEIIRQPVALHSETPLMRLMRGEVPLVHLVDVKAETGSWRSDPTNVAAVELGGIRTFLAVPLQKDGIVQGAITAYRREVRPFTDKQIALLQNFAAQAVIAMENARLITETREALEQQTATAEVLQVINSSPGDLAPVFDAILEKGMSLCQAAFGILLTYDGERFHHGALHSIPAAYAEFMREHPPIYGPGTAPGQLASGEHLVHVVDMTDTEPYRSGDPNRRAIADLAGARTLVAVPLRKDSALLGAIVVFRQEVRPFTDKQIALLQNFAAQAVIAMENARLITETREALEQQTATAEVLGVINASPGDLAPVFDAMLEKATALCDAPVGTLWLFEGEYISPVATHGASAAFTDFLGRGPHRPNPVQLRQLHGEGTIHLTDLKATSLYRDGDTLARASADLGSVQTVLSVPLRREDRVLGLFGVYRHEKRPFSDKQIALVGNFAAQAVIAMENARLITETREALEQQTATAEVLGIINASPGDLGPVFDAVLEKAHSLCGAEVGSLLTYDGDLFHPAARRGVPGAWREAGRAPYRPRPHDPLARLVSGQNLAHVADLAEIVAAAPDDARLRAAFELGGARTVLAVALRREQTLLGAIIAHRPEVRPFTDRQIALLQNFAAQAVIAMENARLITETREALEQQTATAEVLQVINSSPGDLTPVFEAMLDKAMHLCGAAFGQLHTYDGEGFPTAALRGLPAAYAEYQAKNPPTYGPGTAPWRIVQGEHVVHLVDLANSEAYRAGDAARRATVDLGGCHTLLTVALRRENTLLGTVSLYRQEARPFSDKQIALLQNFAAQAVIAMENARLIIETREALEQQTATAEVLQVINSSPGDLAPVFDAMLEKAMRLCGAAFGEMQTYDGGRFQMAALRGLPPRYAEFRTSRTHVYGPGTIPARLLSGERPVHVLDITAEDAYRDGEPNRLALADLGGARTVLAVPLLKDAAVLGFIVAYRQEIRPFSDKQIALLQNFAAQAVIAMENARLLGELRGRTRDLQESLEYQTATSDVLKVISQSTFDLEPVLQAVVETAVRICEGDRGGINLLHPDGFYRMVAGVGGSPEYKALMARTPIAPGRGSLVGRTALEGRIVHIPDVEADPEFTFSEGPRVGGFRTMLGVPLLRDGKPIGVLVVVRNQVRPFSEKQIALFQTFADQAVIAIENARLLNELRERTDELAQSVEELKALSEVGQAVSSTLDLRGVLSTILNRSVDLSGADAGAIFRYRLADRSFRFVEAVGYSEAMMHDVRQLDVGEGATGLGIAIANRAPLQIPDLRERPPNPLRDQAIAAGYRSVLIVPLVGADRVLGATVLQRRAVGEFPEATVRLMQTLAAQSALAIQNARLFNEIAEKSEQLAEASRHKSQFLANMSHELRTPLNAILGYTELMADGIYGELAPRAMGVLERVQNNGKHLLALINDVLDLAKIEAGQLTLSLEDYALPDVVQSVVSATEGLATSKGLKFTADIMTGLPTGHGDARRLSQVLLNLVGNAVKFTDAGEVAITAAAEDGQFVLTVRDTGPGIAPTDQAKIFEEFQQVDSSNTRKKGGTGLGLAISKRMVEMQGGTISVDSALGHGATFRVTLPIRVEETVEELMGAA